ncbi:MAG: PH domain-containing protein [Muribaculaceae bacterium]|nr:PH domain-containing protein [Muribaculaceae bacterium]
MKSKVKFSTYSIILTIVIIAVLVGLCIYTENNFKFYFLFSLLFVMLMFGCLYAPMQIEADDESITVKGILKSKKIPIDRIADIETFQPTMGAIRLCGSGGFMGYWGIFREGDVGIYSGFYGRASDCFFIRMKNGDKYVLGCENPGKMVEYIKNNIR